MVSTISSKNSPAKSDRPSRINLSASNPQETWPLAITRHQLCHTSVSHATYPRHRWFPVPSHLVLRHLFALYHHRLREWGALHPVSHTAPQRDGNQNPAMGKHAAIPQPP